MASSSCEDSILQKVIPSNLKSLLFIPSSWSFSLSALSFGIAQVSYCEFSSKEKERLSY